MVRHDPEHEETPIYDVHGVHIALFGLLEKWKSHHLTAPDTTAAL